jgi:acyl transferase domain-containing protein/aryl carrier-like protein
MSNSAFYDNHHGLEIAIVGMSGRFPGARDIDELWRNLRDGVESISFFSNEELICSGIDPTVVRDPHYVKARGVLEDAELFAASFFGFSPREAELMDPQHRLFLECAWEALEHAGYGAEAYPDSIGVYAGVGMNTYLLHNLYPNRDLIGLGADLQMKIGSDKDHLATRVSYKLNLHGPSVVVQTSSSTSLVAIHLACQSLLSGECEVALAGGVAIDVPQKAGYVYQEGGIYSPDGHCRAFDAKAHGTVFGNGVGIIVLKRLQDALADGDCIHAVIKGSAINNDGSLKVGYTAPNVDGQAQVIARALAMADIDPKTVSYIEAHGTGTALGDPIEIAALTRAFRASTDKKGFCAIGSMKTNVGHLGAAAGVTGLIKTVLALKHKLIPPSLHYEQPNPQIDFVNSPFYVNSRLSDWQAGNQPRRAGVSSFGLGGTNAHVVLEEAPPCEASEQSRPWQVLVFSAKTRSELEMATVNLAEHLKQHDDVNLADVAYTLQMGRRAFSHRRMLVCHDLKDTLTKLETLNPEQVLTDIQESRDRPVVFMFPGQGSQYANMALELYQVEPTFREQVDLCSELLKPHLGLDLREVLYPSPEQAAEATQQLQQTWITQPALFVIEYSLAQLWLQWGIHPKAMIGHSIGEYVAACLAGVFSLADAMALVAARGRLMQQLPGGAMLAVPLLEQEVQPLLGRELSLAAINGPSLCVVSGPTAAVEALQERLTDQGVSCLHVHTSHAFHSEMMEPILEPFTEQLKAVNLEPPHIPYVSNVTGTWITAAESTSPSYWVRHLRETVRFAAGLHELSQEPDRILLEVGPGRTLSTLARQHPDKPTGQVMLSSLRHLHDQESDIAFLLNTLGQLWLAGIQVDWAGFYAHEPHRRIPLPPYPFTRQRYWIEPRKKEAVPHTEQVLLRKNPDIADWFYTPSWKQTPPKLFKQGDLADQKMRWLVFMDVCGLGSQIVKRLEQEGQDVITVSMGEQFTRNGDHVYTINPQQCSDYDTLLKELHGLGKLPQTIVHLWSVTPENHVQSGIKSYDNIQTFGFYSLFFLAHALGEQNIADLLRIVTVSNNIQDVTGEEMLYPEKATILGPCKVIPKEYPNLTCSHIDIVLHESGTLQEEELIAQLTAELAMGSSDIAIAYRGRHRWVQIFEPIRVGGKIKPTLRLRERGVYLITGGLGGIGLVLAEYLGRTLRAKLILIGRSAFPGEDEWEHWLATHNDNNISRKIRKIQAFKELGAEIMILSADVADQEQMQAAITHACERFDTIHGVIHAAGTLNDGIMQLKTPEGAARVLSPKVKGTLVLDTLLKDRRLDFLALFSSINSILCPLGQVDYSAANAFLDAFAHSNGLRNRPFTISINWAAWQGVGMAVETAERLAGSKISQMPHYKPMGHPLIDKSITETSEWQTYITEFSVAKHWVLNEHKIRGEAVLPGTAYMEMARAAFDKYDESGSIEIHEIFFISALIVKEDEKKEVCTMLKSSGDIFEFVIMSPSEYGTSEGTKWQTNVMGKIVSVAFEIPRKYKIEEIEERCSERQVIFANKEQLEKYRERSLVKVGPRWNNLKWVKFGKNEAIAFLELPETFSADLGGFKLHPALLDMAIGFIIPRVDDKGAYVPFSYKRMRIHGSLPKRIYSYGKYDENGHSPKGAITFDVIIMDDQGTELVEIEGYTLRRIEGGAGSFLAEATRPRSREAFLDEHKPLVPENRNFRLQKSPPGISGILPRPREFGDRSFHERLVRDGISPREGVDVFNRILSTCPVPQVIVSPVDLHILIEENTGMSPLSPSEILEEAKEGRSSTPSQPSPDIGDLDGAPMREVERILANLWQKVLGIERVGIHDNFFELGGDSVMGIQIFARAREAGLQITINQLFQYPTIAELAAVAGGTQAMPIDQDPVMGQLTLSHSQSPAVGSYKPSNFPEAGLNQEDLDELVAEFGEAEEAH